MDATLLQYQKAAARLSQKLEEEKLPVEKRIIGTLQRFCEDWQEDLDSRQEEVAESRSGRQATMSFMQNMKWMEPLYERLQSGEIPEEMVSGLWMIVEVGCQLPLVHSAESARRQVSWDQYLERFFLGE